MEYGTAGSLCSNLKWVAILTVIFVAENHIYLNISVIQYFEKIRL